MYCYQVNCEVIKIVHANLFGKPREVKTAPKRRAFT